MFGRQTNQSKRTSNIFRERCKKGEFLETEDYFVGLLESNPTVHRVRLSFSMYCLDHRVFPNQDRCKNVEWQKRNEKELYLFLPYIKYQQ